MCEKQNTASVWRPGGWLWSFVSLPMGCGLVPITATAFQPAGDGFDLDSQPQRRCWAVHTVLSPSTDVPWWWPLSPLPQWATVHRASSVLWLYVTVRQCLWHYRGRLSSSVLPSGAQLLSAATGQDVALAGLAFVSAHQATVPALSWCRHNAEAAFVAWTLQSPCVRPGCKCAEGGSGSSLLHVLVSAHCWFVGCFQDGLVPVSGSFRCCSKWWFLPVKHFIFPTIPCVNQGSRMLPRHDTRWTLARSEPGLGQETVSGHCHPHPQCPRRSGSHVAPLGSSLPVTTLWPNECLCWHVSGAPWHSRSPLCSGTGAGQCQPDLPLLRCSALWLDYLWKCDQ